MMAASTKTLKFMPDDDEIHQQIDDESHQHDCRLIDGYFHKNLEIHVSNSFSNKQKHSAFTQTKMF